MNWKRNHINLQTVKQNKTVKFEYEALTDVNVIKVEASCPHCTIPGPYNSKTKILPVQFKTGQIPNHFKLLKKDYTVRKTITVTYSNGKQEVLSFVATIK